MSNVNTKDSLVTIRVSKKQKEMIEREAKKNGLSVSNYILNKCMHSEKNKKRTQKERELCSTLVTLQRTINSFERHRLFYPYDPNLTLILNELKEEKNTLWQYLN